VILYLDTSSLVKVYVEEAHSETVRDGVEAAESVATSRVAYPEVMSAFTRRREEGDLTGGDFERLRESFDRDWPNLVLLPVRERRAGGLAVQHLLRGFDAIHLAAALDLQELVGGESVVFSAFDHRLLRAARSEGLPCLPAAEEPWG
jgi:predicted nucleic acid-binding protein